MRPRVSDSYLIARCNGVKEALMRGAYIPAAMRRGDTRTRVCVCNVIHISKNYAVYSHRSVKQAYTSADQQRRPMIEKEDRMWAEGARVLGSMERGACKGIQ